MQARMSPTQQAAIVKFSCSCKVLQFKLNKKKTLRVMLGKNKNTSTQPLTIGGDVIGTTEQYKYLGTLVNSKLDMDVHWAHVSKGFNSTLYLLKTMRQLGFNQRVLVSVYKSLISSQTASCPSTHAYWKPGAAIQLYGRQPPLYKHMKKQSKPRQLARHAANPSYASRLISAFTKKTRIDNLTHNTTIFPTSTSTTSM